MKLKKYIFGAALGTLSLCYTSCYNADREFPDYQEGTTLLPLIRFATISGLLMPVVMHLLLCFLCHRHTTNC